MIYRFKPQQAGTFYYHGHYREQLTDGLFGPMIVHGAGNDEITFSGTSGAYSVDSSDWTLTITDWYDCEARTLMKLYLSWYLSVLHGEEPIPDDIRVNGITSGVHRIVADRSAGPVRVRLINVAALSMFTVSVDGMPLQLIELDSTALEPLEVSQVTINSAQRTSFVLDWTKLDARVASSDSILLRIAIVTSMYPTHNESAPNRGIYGTYSGAPLNLEWTAQIVFSDRGGQPPSYASPPVLNVYTPADQNTLRARPLIKQPVSEPDYFMPIVIVFEANSDGVVHGNLNGYSRALLQSYPTVPTLYQLLLNQTTVGDFDSITPGTDIIRGSPVSPFVLPFNKTIEVLINNTDTGVCNHIHPTIYLR